jgi:8-oxo-dGTP diphosphatase
MMNEILAAGGVLWRDNEGGVEIAVVHRPRYDDWSLPKGKLDTGETLAQTAFREIKEETGIDSRLGPYLGTVEYFVPTGEKVVHYWAAKAMGDTTSFTPNEEVDEIRWLRIDDASDLLTRESDVEILENFERSPYDTTPLIFLRHAKALARGEWDGEDMDRPLAILGQRQAQKLFATLAPYKIEEIYSSDAARCLETVTPLAHSIGREVNIKRAISEYVFGKKPEKTLDYFKEIRNLVKEEKRSTLLCSHNPILPLMLATLGKKSKYVLAHEKLEPGDAWVLHMKKKKIMQVDYIIAPQV